MSQIGFYRYKTTADVAKTLSWTVNYIVVATKNIQPIDTCGDDLILKYLDKNGQYRFYPFNKYYETNDTPDKIGSVNKFLSNILTDQSSESNIGYTNERTINASADVPKEHLIFFSDLYTSPRVYLYVGTTTDMASDWIEVEVEVLNPIIKRRKRNSGLIDIRITLPEWYTIKMI